MTLNKKTEMEKDPFEGGYDEHGNEVKAELGMDEEYVLASKFTGADLQSSLKNNENIVDIKN